jgi:CelD/BcsL family acetyltransferase involved in cellulose biosynthesis
MDIEVVRPKQLDCADAARWSELRHALGQTSPFLSPDWVQACAAAGGPDSRRARVAILRESGRAVGFLPARVSRFAAQPVGAPMNDYQGVAVEPGVAFDPRQVVRALGVHRLDFDTQLAEQAEMARFIRGRAASHVIDLREGFDAYAKSRKAAGSDVLQDCAKKRRKIGRELGEVRFTAASASQADFEQLIAWKRARYAETGQTDIFDAGWTLRLLANLFAAPVGELAGKLFTLQAGERLLAAHYALTDGQTLHAWFIAHDETAGKYSPGVVLIADILKWAAENAMMEVDLGAGDYRFKTSLASLQRDVGYGYVGRPSPASALRAAAYGVRAAAEALPLGRASAWPGKAMRRIDLWRGLHGGWSPAR